MTLTIIILTFNEEINLQRCLDSVAWADERLVVDSGSTDRTLAIAEANGVRFLVRSVRPFLISEQRNWALEKGEVKTDWVLFLDADEVITPELRQEIQVTLATASPAITAYRLAPKFMFMGRWLKHCQGFPSWHDRIVRPGLVRYAGGVWEHFVTQGQIGCIQEPYLHFSLAKGIGEWFIKHERYATAEAQDLAITLGWQCGDITLEQRTRRKRWLRNLAAYFWPLRPLARFSLMYFVKRGFLDGLPGLLYCLMISCYEYMIVLKAIELRRKFKALTI